MSDLDDTVRVGPCPLLLCSFYYLVIGHTTLRCCVAFGHRPERYSASWLMRRTTGSRYNRPPIHGSLMTRLMRGLDIIAWV